MYAVINTGGKQYKVEEGSVLKIEKIQGEINSRVVFKDVIMFFNGDTIKLGTPNLDNVVVNAHILDQNKFKKIIVFKYKRRKRYRRKYGHRQNYTKIIVDSIDII